MTKAQTWILVVIVAIILAAIIGIHVHDEKAAAETPQENKTQIDAANDCVLLCQTVFDESGGTDSQKEQSCENACYTSAGVSSSTASQ